jgi:hypothetical protein
VSGRIQGWHHDIKLYGTRHNDTYIDTHNFIKKINVMSVAAIMFCVAMLSVVVLNVISLSVVMFSVIRLSDVAPLILMFTKLKLF